MCVKFGIIGIKIYQIYKFIFRVLLNKFKKLNRPLEMVGAFLGKKVLKNKCFCYVLVLMAKGHTTFWPFFYFKINFTDQKTDH